MNLIFTAQFENFSNVKICLFRKSIVPLDLFQIFQYAVEVKILISFWSEAAERNDTNSYSKIKTSSF